MTSRHERQHHEKGAGLARGPALAIGTVLAALGLILLLDVGDATLSTSGFPDATTDGETVLGFGVNAWTAWSTTVAGVVLLVAAAQHLVAKTVSLLVGLALGAASVIALVDGDDVFGLAAANGWTALFWGVVASILLANTLAPRLRRKRTTREPAGRATPEPAAAPAQPAGTERNRQPAFADLRAGGEGAPERDGGRRDEQPARPTVRSR